MNPMGSGAESGSGVKKEQQHHHWIRNVRTAFFLVGVPKHQREPFCHQYKWKDFKVASAQWFFFSHCCSCCALDERSLPVLWKVTCTADAHHVDTNCLNAHLSRLGSFAYNWTSTQWMVAWGDETEWKGIHVLVHMHTNTSGEKNTTTDTNEHMCNMQCISNQELDSYSFQLWVTVVTKLELLQWRV